MLAVKSANIRDNFKEWCDKISMGETVVISRPRNENIYMINEAEYNELQKAKKNAEYLAMLERADEQVKNGQVVVKTMEELIAMEEYPVMQIAFAEEGWSQYLYWQSQDKKVIKRINQLLQSVERDGALQGIGKPEKLKYGKSGLFSRRIDEANRLVYEIIDNQIIVKSCKGHYED